MLRGRRRSVRIFLDWQIPSKFAIIKRQFSDLVGLLSNVPIDDPRGDASAEHCFDVLVPRPPRTEDETGDHLTESRAYCTRNKEARHCHHDLHSDVLLAQPVRQLSVEHSPLVGDVRVGHGPVHGDGAALERNNI